MRRPKASIQVALVPMIAISLCSAGAQTALTEAQTKNSINTLESSNYKNTQQPLPTPEQLGDSLVGHQRYQAAIAAYSKSPEKTSVIWNKMGIAYQLLFNEDDASRCYKQSLKLDPSNAQVWNNLGTVYSSMKSYGQADRMYRQAIKLDPKSAILLKNYGTSLLAQHKYNRGWDMYQRALAIDPQIFADHDGPTVADPSSIHERGAMNYYMAAGCARSGFVDCALQYLRLALDEGFTTRKKLEADNDFASLRADHGFQKLMAEEHSQ